MSIAALPFCIKAIYFGKISVQNVQNVCSGTEVSFVRCSNKGNLAYLEGQIVHSRVITSGLLQLHVPSMDTRVLDEC